MQASIVSLRYKPETAMFAEQNMEVSAALSPDPGHNLWFFFEIKEASVETIIVQAMLTVSSQNHSWLECRSYQSWII